MPADITPLTGLALAAALALLAGGLWLLRQPGGNRTKAVLGRSGTAGGRRGGGVQRLGEQPATAGLMAWPADC